MTNATMESLNTKIEMHISAQREMNQSLVASVEKLTDTVSDIKVFQAEVNRLTEKVGELEKRTAATEGIVGTNTAFIKDAKHIKMTLIVAIVGIVATGVWSLLAKDPNAALVQQMAELTRQIAAE